MGCDLLADEMVIGDIRVRAVDLPHGAITSAGLHFDADGRSVVYYTDFNVLPPEAATLVEDCDLWIVDAVRRTAHPTHPHLARTLGWIEALKPRRAILTHMDQSMDYATLAAELPIGVEPGYDDMIVEL